MTTLQVGTTLVHSPTRLHDTDKSVENFLPNLILILPGWQGQGQDCTMIHLTARQLICHLTARQLICNNQLECSVM